MNDLADLFPGFETHWIDTGQGRFFARAKGDGPPLLLLHGYPQTHVEWHRIAPALAERFRVVAMDLRGYGWSSVPPSAKGEGYAKRVMARDAIDVMQKLGALRFHVAGHDRGGRVGCRLALDAPERLLKLAVIDIIPTLERWEAMDSAGAMAAYHWTFLAQPEPLPETLIGPNAVYYLNHTLASWTASKNLAAFDPRALAHYRAGFNEPNRIHAACEDYRAGAAIDRDDDAADRAAGRKIAAPLLALWGGRGLGGGGASTLDIWRRWAPKAEGRELRGGHFLPEENPDETAAALLAFFAD
ncbi:alpha/beta fold hydrolase [Methylocella sp.]|uniref:alpha/beta fold hydrolase n=1 Tax=Methylocella sp. TaxID=1978226 RepID=UPI003784BA8D